MTRKRFIKLLMSQGVQRHDAEAIARMVRMLQKEGEQKMKEIKLRKCPCCDSEARFVYTSEADKRRVRVVCYKCDLSTRWVDESLDYGAKEEAAKVWNRRVIDIYVS